jgi:ABC-2 type transport system permease protein
MWGKKYLVMAQVAAKNSATTWLVVVVGNVQTVLLFFALYAVYKTAFAQGTPQSIGMTLADVLWSMSIYSLFWAVGARAMANQISDLVTRGSVEVHLVRPASFLFSQMAARFGRNWWLTWVQIILVVTLMLLLVGAPSVTLSLAIVWRFAILFILGMGLGYGIYTFIGILSFWLQDVKPVLWIMDKMVMIFAGAYLPVALMPDGMRLFAQWSPFGAILPATQVFHEAFMQRFAQLLLSQIFWIVLCYGGMYIVWHRATKKLSLNGG